MVEMHFKQCKMQTNVAVLVYKLNKADAIVTGSKFIFKVKVSNSLADVRKWDWGSVYWNKFWKFDFVLNIVDNLK